MSGAEPMVTRQDRGPVTWLTLNRPDAMNALDTNLLGELDVHARSVADDPAVRVVVITATGRAFCAGADLKAVLGAGDTLDPARMLGFERQAQATFARVAALPKPTIAALNGITMAGGLELALHCDLVIASSQARIGDGHTNYGLLPGAGGAARLPRVIGPTRAKYLAFTGELLAAEQAMSMGLVVEVVPPDELEPRVEKLSQAIARRSPSALRLFKQVIDDGLDQPLPSAMRLELLATAEHLHSGDVDEGLRAFAEKREPRFTTTEANHE
ncbi:short chain enoyl-CoA hydratase [Antricoccus suffuscus]|uniref:Short chain enoyl-CoA hydratase n=1 Tax=Antricoccus suffuscus TaxID=1629062 RepID=A0A2T1A5T5_9ACTN|nr:enoyl-CoA hydratase/isomerase family protein [Antricoccus suffuscus]PRZ43950.1 short chain enoyl-CoA hydratase [Antricoccus suffuscus]